MTAIRTLKIAALLAAGAALGSLGTFSTLKAQTGGLERTMLLTGKPVAASDKYEAVMARVTIAPGITAAKHNHPGDELGVILEGDVQIDVEGQMLTLKAGEAYHIPAGKAHTPKNAGATPAKVVAIWVVEKGKPLSANVP